MVRVGSQVGLRARLAVHVLMVSGRNDRVEMVTGRDVHVLMVSGRNIRVGMVNGRDARGEMVNGRNDHVVKVTGRSDHVVKVTGRSDRGEMVNGRDARGETMIARNVRRARRSVVPTRFAAVQVGANTSVEKCRTSVPRKNDGSMRGQSASRRLEGSVTRLPERKRVVRASKRCNHVLLVH